MLQIILSIYKIQTVNFLIFSRLFPHSQKKKNAELALLLDTGKIFVIPEYF